MGELNLVLQSAWSRILYIVHCLNLQCCFACNKNTPFVIDQSTILMTKEIKRCSKYAGVSPLDGDDFDFSEKQVKNIIARPESQNLLVSATFVYSASQINLPVSFPYLNSTLSDAISFPRGIKSTENWLATKSKYISKLLHKNVLNTSCLRLGNGSFRFSWNYTLDSNKTNNSANSISKFLTLTIGAPFVGTLIICMSIGATIVAIRKHRDRTKHTECGETNDNMIGKQSLQKYMNFCRNVIFSILVNPSYQRNLATIFETCLPDVVLFSASGLSIKRRLGEGVV